ncbi:hypothetical protein AAG570_007703 [Ranatra chinensis]|uniref:Odorant receptor n=1 Tax=Ranatra chinensis TaxID=642074 RepID=A0ABD0XUE9_9HEMI
MMEKQKMHGLVGDVWPNLQMMKYSGHWILEYDQGNRPLRLAYCWITSLLMVVQVVFLFCFLLLETYDADQMAAATITLLFFLHGITKFVYFAARNRYFYRTIGAWNQVNSHPLFAESNARHRATALKRIRRLLTLIGVITVFSVVSWVTVTFLDEPMRTIRDPENVTSFLQVEVPQLMIDSWYPWDARTGFAYISTFIYQLYWLIMTLSQANLLDVLFCSFVIFACEQLKHLKEILQPLMELSATLDSVVPNSGELFRSPTTAPSIPFVTQDDFDIRGIYSEERHYSGFRRHPVSMVGNGGVGPNGLSKKQELLVRSAIKYWVERHKHVVKFVSSIGEAYGVALLLHMLTSTVTLTLLAYQATKIEGVDVYGASVIGYLLYTLGQVFVFCIHGNELIEESSSVMEAAYSCHWYDGSEEAKTFVQIVCQQCQKSLSISGAKFFTVSLDLFASVSLQSQTNFSLIVCPFSSAYLKR